MLFNQRWVPDSPWVCILPQHRKKITDTWAPCEIHTCLRNTMAIMGTAYWSRKHVRFKVENEIWISILTVSYTTPKCWSTSSFLLLFFNISILKALKILWRWNFKELCEKFYVTRTLHKISVFIIIIRKYFIDFSKNKVGHFSISFSPHSGILVVSTSHSIINNPLATRNFHKYSWTAHFQRDML